VEKGITGNLGEMAKIEKKMAHFGKRLPSS
jgi:hypothetical protein